MFDYKLQERELRDNAIASLSASLKRKPQERKETKAAYRERRRLLRERIEVLVEEEKAELARQTTYERSLIARLEEIRKGIYQMFECGCARLGAESGWIKICNQHATNFNKFNHEPYLKLKGIKIVYEYPPPKEEAAT